MGFFCLLLGYYVFVLLIVCCLVVFGFFLLLWGLFCHFILLNYFIEYCWNIGCGFMSMLTLYLHFFTTSNYYRNRKVRSFCQSEWLRELLPRRSLSLGAWNK